MIDLVTLVSTGVLVGLGALVQSSIGFGLAVVAAPLIILIEPGLMPVSLLMAGFMLPAIQLGSGHRDIAWPMFRWAILGRYLLTPVGVLLVVRLPASAIGALVGVLVLVAVAFSIWSVDVCATRGRALGAGLITGVAGTAASVGGPFLALVLQHERPERARGTLAAFFLAGSAFSLASLAVAGQVTSVQVVTGLAWLPFIVAGHLAAGPLRRRLDPVRFRRAVLVLAVVASLVVITRSVLSTVTAG